MSLNFQPPSFVGPNQHPDIPRTLDDIYNSYMKAKQFQGQQDMQKLQFDQAKQEMAQRNLQMSLQYGFNPQEATPGRISEALNPAPVANGYSEGREMPGTPGVLQQPRIQAPGNPFQDQINQANEPIPDSHPVVGRLRELFQMRKQSDALAMHAKMAEVQKTTAEAGLANAKAGGGIDSYNLDQAAYFSNPYAADQEMAQTKDKLSKLYPGGMVPKDAVHQAAASGRTDINVGEKDKQFTERQWQQLAKSTNPNVAARGSLLGVAGQANARADRAAVTLSDPNASGQQIAGAVADLAGILQGGVPSEAGRHEQSFRTLQNEVNKFKEFITSKPQSANQPEVVAKLKKLIADVKEVDNKIISDNLDTQEITYADTIAKTPERWKKYRESIVKTMKTEGQGGDIHLTGDKAARLAALRAKAAAGGLK